MSAGIVTVFTSTESTALPQSLTHSVCAPKVRTGLGVPMNLGIADARVLCLCLARKHLVSISVCQALHAELSLRWTSVVAGGSSER